jgi:hypothetical protein
MGFSISDHRTCGSDLWIWRYRCGISWHRQTSVRYIPCAVHNLFDFRVARQTRALSHNEFLGELQTPADKDLYRE